MSAILKKMTSTNNTTKVSAIVTAQALLDFSNKVVVGSLVSGKVGNSSEEGGEMEVVAEKSGEGEDDCEDEGGEAVVETEEPTKKKENENERRKVVII